MFQFQNIQCNDSQNKPLLEFKSLDDDSKGAIKFDDGTMYFIIGKSGIGKSTLLNFFTSPFSEDPIKSGTIHFDDSAPAPLKNNSPLRDITVKNSAGEFAKPYFAYIRKQFAFIPQFTNSFHPGIPLVKQLRNTYESYIGRKFKRNSEDAKKFRGLVAKLGGKAGFTHVKSSI